MESVGPLAQCLVHHKHSINGYYYFNYYNITASRFCYSQYKELLYITIESQVYVNSSSRPSITSSFPFNNAFTTSHHNLPHLIWMINFSFQIQHLFLQCTQLQVTRFVEVI